MTPRSLYLTFAFCLAGSAASAATDSIGAADKVQDAVTASRAGSARDPVAPHRAVDRFARCIFRRARDV